MGVSASRFTTVNLSRRWGRNEERTAVLLSQSGTTMVFEDDLHKGTDLKPLRLSELKVCLKSKKVCPDLPPLCQRVHKQQGCGMCLGALELIQSLLPLARDRVLVVCCCNVLKIVVVHVSDKDAWLMVTRNVLPDYVHLSETADRLKISVDEFVADLWEPIKPFNEGLAQRFVTKISEYYKKNKSGELASEAKVVESKLQQIVLLGSIYNARYPIDRPSVDVAAYNVIKAFALRLQVEGLVSIPLATRIDANTCIVRLITKLIGGSAKAFPIPILGFSLPATGSAVEAISSSVVKLLSQSITDQAGLPERLHEPLMNEDKSAALLNFYSDQPLDAKTKADLVRYSEIAVRIAVNRLGHLCVQKLKPRPIHVELVDILDTSWAARVDSEAGPGTLTFCRQVIQDVLTLVKSDFWNEAYLAQTGFFEKIFALLDSYSPVTPAANVDTQVRQRMLKEDLFNGSSNYVDCVEKSLMSHTLRKSRFSDDWLMACWNRFHESCGDPMFDALVSEEKATGYNYLEKLPSILSRSKGRVPPRLYGLLSGLWDRACLWQYEASLKGFRKKLYDFKTDYLGAIVGGLTFGIVPWDTFSETMKRKLCVNFHRKNRPRENVAASQEEP